MGTTAVIGLGILAWVLLSILLALFIGRVIALRERQRPDPTELGTLSREDRSGGGAEPARRPPGWQPRNKT